MSLMIKGIDLPIEGGYKDIRIYPSGNVDLRLLNEHIPTDCKAIQIPKDHGRLIDGDAFIRHLQDIFCDKCAQHKKYGGTVCRICYINDVILEYGDAPTILKGEKR